MTRYVVPALATSLGLAPAAAEYARLSETVSGPKDMSYFVPVILSWSGDGIESALPRPTNTSGDFSSLAATDGFIELPSGRGEHRSGSFGRIYRW
jgi:molybdopterin molybdotransferase